MKRFTLSAQRTENGQWITTRFDTMDEAKTEIAKRRMEFYRPTPRGGELPVWGKMYVTGQAAPERSEAAKR